MKLGNSILSRYKIYGTNQYFQSGSIIYRFLLEDISQSISPIPYRIEFIEFQVKKIVKKYNDTR